MDAKHQADLSCESHALSSGETGADTHSSVLEETSLQEIPATTSCDISDENQIDDDLKTKQILEILQKYWGYDSFRPLQLETMLSVLHKQDSVVVLPTGGGKSLCYQVPALLREGLSIVVSPLIALMKDQVDALKECGISAEAINSSLSADERLRIAKKIRNRELKILYVAPERLCTEKMLSFLEEQNVSFIAVDEAHCISSWGHSFRPEYRILGELRQRFPHIDMHAFTATATEQVRQDIADQLNLESPEYFIGNFDRPNLTYRVTRRDNFSKQVRAVIDRYAGEAGIIYCTTRKQVENVTADLKQDGYRAVAYHAGMEHGQRERSQNDFLNEKADIVVATIAFGMGIDKPNVRFVIHASVTKSLENYQQETGRAGRDGLPAECCLFYGGSDFVTWKMILSDLQGDAAKIADEQLALINRFCTSVTCRHRQLVEHFSQSYSPENCNACDACLGELKQVDDALIISQKILSCVYRLNEQFGGEYVSNVLTGSKDQRLLENRHDQLSTYGLLSEHKKKSIRDWVEQLIGQGCLERYGEYNTLRLTAMGRKVFKEEFTPILLEPAKQKKTGTSSRRSPRLNLGDLDENENLLFEALRLLRREIASGKNVPPFVVFGDVTLIDMAKKKPVTEADFLEIHGVGRHKSAQYSEQFIGKITEFCEQHDVVVETNSKPSTNYDTEKDEPQRLSGSALKAAAFFDQGMSIEQVAKTMGRAISTTSEYLAEYLLYNRTTSPEPWLDTETFQKITSAAFSIDSDRLKPLYEKLDNQIPYEQLRIAVVCLKNLDLKQEDPEPSC